MNANRQSLRSSYLGFSAIVGRSHHNAVEVGGAGQTIPMLTSSQSRFMTTLSAGAFHANF
jgi:hypothetical protein